MENKTIFCRNCGKELPEESSFCPYCMTKFTEEKTVEPIKEKKSKKKLITGIIIGAVALVVCIALVITGIFVVPSLFGGEENQGINMDGFASSDSKGKDVELGLTSRKNSSELNDFEKLLIQYYDDNYMRTTYDHIIQMSDLYKDAGISFYGTVTSLIESGARENIYYIEFGSIIDVGGYGDHTGNFVAIKTKEELKIGETIFFFGTLTGTETFEIDGKNSNLPCFRLDRTATFSFMYYEPDVMYTKNEISQIAKFFFGNETKIRQSSNKDLTWLPSDYYEDFSQYYYIAEPVKAGENDNAKYALFTGPGGYVTDCDTESHIERYINFSADFEHFYIRTYDTNLNTVTFECYDKSYKKLWQREFANCSDISMDFTTTRIYLGAGDKLYIIDAETGEDAVTPVKINPAVAVRKFKDAILIVSRATYDGITKLDLDGNILWTINLGLAPEKAKVQIVNNNYVIQTTAYDYTYGSADTSVVTSLISKDGKVINTTSESI